MDENNAIDVVEHLIQRCRDGQNGFREAAEKVKRTDLKAFFNQVSEERGRFAQELQVELATPGQPDKQVSGSTEGALHRAWVDTKVALGGDDHTVLDWLEHGEDVRKRAELVHHANDELEARRRGRRHIDDVRHGALEEE